VAWRMAGFVVFFGKNTNDERKAADRPSTKLNPSKWARVNAQYARLVADMWFNTE